MDDEQLDQAASILGFSAEELSSLRATPVDLARYRPDADGKYAWDRWETRALAAGVATELAQLGRAVMREAVQHDWNQDLQAECGWDDEGQEMIQLALAGSAASRWEHLLNTDGERGRWTAGGSWEPFDG